MARENEQCRALSRRSCRATRPALRSVRVHARAQYRREAFAGTGSFAVPVRCSMRASCHGSGNGLPGATRTGGSPGEWLGLAVSPRGVLRGLSYSFLAWPGRVWVHRDVGTCSSANVPRGTHDQARESSSCAWKTGLERSTRSAVRRDGRAKGPLSPPLTDRPAGLCDWTWKGGSSRRHAHKICEMAAVGPCRRVSRETETLCGYSRRTGTAGRRRFWRGAAVRCVCRQALAQPAANPRVPRGPRGRCRPPARGGGAEVEARR